MGESIPNNHTHIVCRCLLDACHVRSALLRHQPCCLHRRFMLLDSGVELLLRATQLVQQPPGGHALNGGLHASQPVCEWWGPVCDGSQCVILNHTFQTTPHHTTPHQDTTPLHVSQPGKVCFHLGHAAAHFSQARLSRSHIGQRLKQSRARDDDVWWMMICRPNVRNCCLLVFKCC